MKKGIAQQLLESFGLFEDDHGDYIPSQDEINKSAAAPVASGSPSVQTGHPIFTATPQKIARFKQLMSKAQAAHGKTSSAPNKTTSPAPTQNKGQSAKAATPATAPSTQTPATQPRVVPADDVPDIANKGTTPAMQPQAVPANNGQSGQAAKPNNITPAVTTQKAALSLNSTPDKLAAAFNALPQDKKIKLKQFLKDKNTSILGKLGGMDMGVDDMLDAETKKMFNTTDMQTKREIIGFLNKPS